MAKEKQEGRKEWMDGRHYAVLMFLVAFLGIILVFGVAYILQVPPQGSAEFMLAVLGVPGAAVGFVEAARQRQRERKDDAEATKLQQAAYLKEFLWTFFSSDEIHAAFYDLVYNYPNKEFREVARLDPRPLAALPPGKKEERTKDGDVKPSPWRRKDLPSDQERVAFASAFAKAFPNQTVIGRRFYHPDFFQGTPEERRLDKVLSFFEVVGHFREKNVLDEDTIQSALGPHLVALKESDCIAYYLDSMERFWDKLGHETPPPWEDLRKFLDPAPDPSAKAPGKGP